MVSYAEEPNKKPEGKVEMVVVDPVRVLDALCGGGDKGVPDTMKVSLCRVFLVITTAPADPLRDKRMESLLANERVENIEEVQMMLCHAMQADKPAVVKTCIRWGAELGLFKAEPKETDDE